MRTNNPIKQGVSLYSYQEAFFLRNLDLEGVLTAVAGAGAEGVEIFGEAMIRDFPFVSDEFLYKWFYMMDNLGLEPLCYEHFADRTYNRDHSIYLSDDDVFDLSVQYIKTAQKLGCKFIRLSHDGHNGMWIMNDEKSHTVVNANIFERLLPVAQEHGIVMALEVHAPGHLDDGGNDDFLEAIDRTGIKAGGLMLDFSCMLRDDFPNNVKSMIQKGANPDCIEFVRENRCKAWAYKTTNDGEPAPYDWDAVVAKVKEMGGSPMDVGYAQRAATQRVTPPKVVKEYASKLVYVHGKVNWVNEDCTSDEMDYPLYINALKEGGYTGYISTELEGQRVIPNTVNEVEQVRRQHVLLRNCLG